MLWSKEVASWRMELYTVRKVSYVEKVAGAKLVWAHPRKISRSA